MSKKLYRVSIQHDRSVKDMIHSALEELGGLHHIIPFGESSAVGDNTMKAFQVTGMDKIAEKHGVKIIDFKKSPRLPKKFPTAKQLRP